MLNGKKPKAEYGVVIIEKENKMGKENQLGNFLSPEAKNIIAKYNRLCYLTEQMKVPQKKTTDLVWLIENLPLYYSKHKHFDESMNLVNKLIVIKKW